MLVDLISRAGQGRVVTLYVRTEA
ncbi:MAG: hypothetical protein CISAcid_05740 [uncultured Acidilobus sp. CIS]|nr:MAG: hypothetical protein CISAcid_05740 [uncultured Acidilobus sp. CIS]